jgi:Flp pilus assembly protein TadD
MLSQIEEGDPTAADRLLPLVYAELRQLAAARLSHEQPGPDRRALQWLEEANQVPPKSGPVLSTLGLALYRLGRFEDAVIILESAYKINTSGYYNEPRTDLICMAMAQHRLGRTEEAHKTLAQSRERRGLVPPHLVREAEALIESKKSEPKK